MFLGLLGYRCRRGGAWVSPFFWIPAFAGMTRLKRLLRLAYGEPRNDRVWDKTAFFTVFGSMHRILAIFLYDMPNRCNSVAFCANFWYK